MCSANFPYQCEALQDLVDLLLCHSELPYGTEIGTEVMRKVFNPLRYVLSSMVEKNELLQLGIVCFQHPHLDQYIRFMRNEEFDVGTLYELVYNHFRRASYDR